MKQGSTDDPFAEEPAATESDADTADDGTDDAPDQFSEETVDSEAEPEPQSTTDTAGSGRRSLPYIHARDGVKDGRTQRPVFLREHIEDGIGELVARMEAEFGEDVYKTDVTEAAMAVAQEHPELVVEKLDEWGYGWA